MTNLVQYMTHAAMADRLDALALDLRQAALAGDMARVAQLDHALRSTVIALVGGAPLLEGDDTTTRLGALTRALSAVTDAVAQIKAQNAPNKRRGTLVYMRANGRAE